MFMIAKQRKEGRKDVTGARYIKDEDGLVQLNEAEIMQGWRRYYKELLKKKKKL